MIDPRLIEALRRTPELAGHHLLLSVAALVAGVGTSLPLAVIAARRPRLARPLQLVASAVQTIPALALLALFYPLLLALSKLTSALAGRSVPALGFLPAFLALALYSALPVLRNTLAGLASVDRAVVKAARGMGMTDRQLLWRIELPLAAPTILAGVRTAAVWVVGTAALSTPIGQPSLGNLVFTGLQTEDWFAVLVGCIAAAALALTIDAGLAAAERWAGRRPAVLVPVVALGVLLATAAGAAVVWRPAPSEREVIVGAKTFSEQFVLAELIRTRLERAGVTTTVREGLGSVVAFRALVAGDVDVYVDYTGTLWANAMGRRGVRPAAEVRAEVARWLDEQHGVLALGTLGFENAYALAMRSDRARALGVRSLVDLASHAPQLAIGGDYEFFARPEWEAIRTTYGLAFRQQRQYQSTFMYRAVASGDVDVISAFSSDGRIAAFDLVVLDDPLGAIPPYEAVVLLSRRARADPRIGDALAPLIGAIDLGLMQRINAAVDLDGVPVVEAARRLDAMLARPRLGVGPDPN